MRSTSWHRFYASAGFALVLAIGGCLGGGGSGSRPPSSGGPGPTYTGGSATTSNGGSIPISTGGVPSSGGDTAYASVAWSVYDIEDTGYVTPLACSDVGAAWVVVTLTDQATGTTYPQPPVNCSDGQMSTGIVPPGNYAIGFDLYGDATIYGNSTTLLDSFDETGTFQLFAGANDLRYPVAPFQVQAFMVDWSISYAGMPSNCGTEGATEVELDFTVSGGSAPVRSIFNCTSYTGASYSIPYGSVSAQWSLYLIDGQGRDMTGLVSAAPISIPANANVDLGSETFGL